MEPSKNNKVEFMKVLKDMATLGDKRSEEAKSDNLGKEPDRPKHKMVKFGKNSAGRHDVATKSRKRRIVGLFPIRNSASVAILGMGERALTGTCKRTTSEQSTPNFSVAA